VLLWLRTDDQVVLPGSRNMMWLPTYAEDHWVLRPEVLEELCEKDPGKGMRVYCARMLVMLTL
jgi:hypothetical protein